MKPRTILLALALLMGFAVTAWAQFFGPGPTSPYYVTQGGTIYVVQGSPRGPTVWSFPDAYGGGNAEGVLAVTCGLTVPYMPCGTYSLGSIRTRLSDGIMYSGGQGGEYTLDGTPTGVSYFVNPDGLVVYDGTTDTRANYFVDHAPVFDYGSVYVADRYWQNQGVLFAQDQVIRPTGITYDPYDKSLWLSDGPSDIIAEYSLDGRLLYEFHTGLGGNSALAFDPADGTLWMTTGSGGNLHECVPGRGVCLEQWSTTGQPLQFGNVPSLPISVLAAGEMAEPTPEPGTILLVGSGVLGLAGFLRGKLLR